MMQMKLLLIVCTLLVAASAVEASDALEKMATVFVGNYSRAEIKAELDSVLRLHGMPRSEENYSRSGSVLVSLRKSYGVREMDILSCMKGAGGHGSFPDLAAICCVTLAE